MFLAYDRDYLSPELLVKVINNYNICGLFPSETFFYCFKISDEMGYFMDFKRPMTNESINVLSTTIPQNSYCNNYFKTMVNNNPRISIVYLQERNISNNHKITALEDRLRLAGNNISFVNYLLEQQINKVYSFDRFFNNLEETHKKEIENLKKQIRSIKEECDNLISLIKIFYFEKINRKFSVKDISDLKLYVFGGSFSWQSNIIELSKKIYCYTGASPSFTKEELDQADFIIINYKEINIEHLYQIKNLVDESKLIFIFDNKISNFINAIAIRKFFKYGNSLRK